MLATGQRLAVLLIAVLLTACLLAAPAAAQGVRVDQLEIDVSEIEAAQGQYKPIPTPEPGHPARMLFDSQRVDLTGTLPEAVLESMLGASPMDFVAAVWEMEVTGGWTDHLTGEGTLQVFNFTEGMGASARPDPDRFTGAMGMRTYAAVLDTPHGHEFRLSAAFPADADGMTPDTEPDSNFNSPKSVLFVVGCHMFEPGHTGCIQTPRPPPEYYTTEQPTLEKMHITVRGDSTYRILFSARVEETRHYVENTRYINGRPHHDWREEPSGRVGHVEGWVCDRASWEADPETCIPQHEPLRVVENTPENERENVNFETAGIGWEFSAPVDAASLEGGFTLITRDRAGKDIEVPGAIIEESPSRFSFQPEAPLESGVMYEARLAGGSDGVRARDRSDGAHLAADHWWRFSTLLDLESQSNSDEEKPLEMHVFQTVRDAPLVTGKPAVIRIYPYWEAHDHIHPEWQPTSFPIALDLNVVSEAERRVERQFGATASTEEFRMHRPDQFNDEHRRRAQHTINVYGWAPEQTGGTSTVEARVRPHDPYPRPLEPEDVIGERDVGHWYADPGPLVFRYTFLTEGSWKEGVPDAARQKAEAAVRRAETFAVQTMPIKEAHGIYVERDLDRGDRTVFFAALEAAVIAAELETGLLEWYAETFPRSVPAVLSDTQAVLDSHTEANPRSSLRGLQVDESVIGRFLTETGRTDVNWEAVKSTIQTVREDVMEHVGAPDDIVVVFYPPDFYGFGQANSGLIHDPARGVGMPIAKGLSADVTAMGLVHEFGHYYGLKHRPGEQSQLGLARIAVAGDVDMTIEGFRLAPDGMSGANKSGTEGNAEVADILVPLMWPGVEVTSKAWVNNEDYEILMRSLGPTSVPDSK